MRFVLWLAFLFTSKALASNWVYFELCSLEHGGKPNIISGQSIRGDAWMRASNIIAIIPHRKIQDCTILILQDGSMISFKGRPIEVACKISHAPSCDEILKK